MIIDKITFFRLYPNVVPTKGYNRSVLVDLFKNELHFVPNGLIDVLLLYDFQNKSVEEILSIENCSERKLRVQEYIEFIVTNDLGILDDKTTIAGLSDLNKNFYADSKIESVIFELDCRSEWNITSCLQKLDLCGAKFLEIRFLDYESFVNNIQEIQIGLNHHTIETVRILVPFNLNIQIYLEENIKHFSRLNLLTIYNTTSGFELSENKINIVFSSQEFVSSECCGNVSAEYFTINTKTYIENRKHNNCLAYKISINKDGIVKNCPSLKEEFGNVDQAEFFKLISNQDFQKYWSITKDQIVNLDMYVLIAELLPRQMKVILESQVSVNIILI